MARVFGAATPLVPAAGPSLPRHPKPISRRSPWNSDSSSVMSRASRHQGPPVHLRHNPSLDDPDEHHEFDAIPPPAARDSGHQRRNIGSRPAMYSRPRMHPPAATATRSAEQPGMPMQSNSERTEVHGEVGIDATTLHLYN